MISIKNSLFLQKINKLPYGLKKSQYKRGNILYLSITTL